MSTDREGSSIELLAAPAGRQDDHVNLINHVSGRSVHRGQKAVARLRSQWSNAHLVHTPIHASWLNQIEIYFSIVQRKALTPNDFSSLAQLEQRLLDFQRYYELAAVPFKWSFTRKDLLALLDKIDQKTLPLAA